MSAEKPTDEQPPGGRGGEKPTGQKAKPAREEAARRQEGRPEEGVCREVGRCGERRQPRRSRRLPRSLPPRRPPPRSEAAAEEEAAGLPRRLLRRSLPAEKATPAEKAEKKPAAAKAEEPTKAKTKEPVATEAKKPTTAARRESTSAPSGSTRKVVRAQARYVRTSARKARMVCGHLRGKSVDEARAILAFTPREVARDWSKLLESAVANAENNHELIEDDLLVREAYADEGPTIKRFRPRAQGRATPIRKRTSHLTITLTPKP